MFAANSCLAAFFLVVCPVFAASAPGIRNFDQVNPSVYRGGQPTAEGFRYLAGLGVKTVIDLREAGKRADAEQKVVTGAGMTYVSVPMNGLTPPTQDEINKVLDLLENRAAGPVFVHCLRGADRTGAVIAAYHVDHDKWDNVRALKDAKAHDMSFFQLPRENFIRSFRARTVEPAASPEAASGASTSTTSLPAATIIAK